MTTSIQSNGSRWAGEEPATIEELLTVLAGNDLDVSAYGPAKARQVFGDALYGFVTLDGDTATYEGNFRDVSHVFNITTDDPEVIARLTAAIRANLDRQAARQE